MPRQESQVSMPHAGLSEWIAPETERERCLLPTTLGAEIGKSARRWGEREAIVYRHQPAVKPMSWTFAQLDMLSSRLASVLLDMDYQRGDRIAVWGPNAPEWILLEFALAKAGLVIVALNPLYRRAELEFALRDSEALAIFHAEHVGAHALAETIEAVRSKTRLRHVHGFSDIWTDLLERDCGPLPAIAVAPEETCMIQYTSGTTGVPRAVRLSHQAVATTSRNAYDRWNLDETSRVCFGFPLFHVGGSGHSVPGSCIMGATAMPLYIFKADITLDILERERCTCFVGVPTMLIAMLDHPSLKGRDLSAMKSAVIGGAPVTYDLQARCRDAFGVDVLNGYGQTETCGVTTATSFADDEAHRIGTCGRPLDGVSVAIRNDAGKAVPHGERGELFYRGPGGMTGYGSKPDDPCVGEGWIASGDLAQMDSAGYVTVVGRKKEMIIRGGENLSPLEIEQFLKLHDAVGDVAVIGLPDRKYGEVACAVIRRREGHHATGEEIRAWCAEGISRWKVPEYVEFVDEFPMTPSGKIQKFVLQEIFTKKLGLADSSKGLGERQT